MGRANLSLQISPFQSSWPCGIFSCVCRSTLQNKAHTNPRGPRDGIKILVTLSKPWCSWSDVVIPPTHSYISMSASSKAQSTELSSLHLHILPTHLEHGDLPAAAQRQAIYGTWSPASVSPGTRTILHRILLPFSS